MRLLITFPMQSEVSLEMIYILTTKVDPACCIYMCIFIDMHTYVYTFVCVHACNNNKPRRKDINLRVWGDGTGSRKDSWEGLEREKGQENMM